MASRDLTADLKTENATDPQTGGAITGTTIDTQGFEAVTLVAVSDGGGSADGDYSFKAQSAADDGTGSPDTWADVAAADLRGAFSENFQADAAVHDEVGVVVNQRFVRLVMVETTAATTAPTVAGVAMLGMATATPV